MSGIEIFKQNPELFVDDDEAAGAEDFQTEYKGLETILMVTGTSIMAVKKKENEIEKEKGKVVEESKEDEEAEAEHQISEQDINAFGIQLGATDEDLNAAITQATFDESLFTEEIAGTEEIAPTEGEVEVEQDDEHNIDQDTEGTPGNIEVSEKYGENGNPED